MCVIFVYLHMHLYVLCGGMGEASAFYSENTAANHGLFEECGVSVIVKDNY